MQLTGNVPLVQFPGDTEILSLGHILIKNTITERQHTGLVRLQPILVDACKGRWRSYSPSA